MSQQGEDRKSLGRRLTTTIRRVMTGKKKEKKEEAKEPEPAAAGPTTEGTSAAAAAAPEAPKTEQADKPRPSFKYRPPKVPTTPPPPMSAAERAQALFKKHGLEIVASDWPLSKAPQGERIQKDIRMRVRRTCHKCETSFGPDKECKKCNHKKCKKCPRHPTKKSKDKGKEKVTAKTTAPGYKRRRGDLAYGLTMPARKAGGQDLVRKQARQRIHRTCHRCSTAFKEQIKVCEKCKHTRCQKCPREPHKTNKPPGYYEARDPSDSEKEEPTVYRPRRTYKKPRQRVRWTCTKCNTVFVEKTKICADCGGARDETGVRAPLKKEKKPRYQPTEEDLARLEERLAQTSLAATS